MQIFRRRPLCFACFLFLAASLAGFYLPAFFTLLSAALCALAGLAFAVRAAVIRIRYGRIPSRRTAVRTVLAVIFSILAIAGLLNSHGYFDVKYSALLEYTGAEAEIEAVVTGMTYSKIYAANYDVELLSVNGVKIKTKLKLRCEYASTLRPGERFRAAVTFEELRDEVNGFAEKRYYLSQGFTLAAVSEDEYSYEILESGVTTPGLVLSKMNDSLSNVISRIMGGGDETALVNALLLGRRSGLPADIKRDVRRIGMSHMLAISGFHLSMLAAGAEYLLRASPLGLRSRRVVMIALMLAYTSLSGFQISAIRAAIMLSAAYAAGLSSGRGDALTSLFAAGALICAVMPGAVIDAGLWLSFCSTLGIILLSSRINRLAARIPSPAGAGAALERPDGARFILIKTRAALTAAARFILSNACVTLTAVVFTLPLMWLYFGEISLISLPANLLLTPLFTLALYLAPFILLLGGIPLICVPLARVAGLLCRILLAAAGAASRLPGVMVSLNYPFAPYIIGIFSVCLIIFLIIKLERKLLALIPAAVCAAAFTVCLIVNRITGAGVLEAVYINSKGNDCIVLKYNGRAAICDISDGSYGIISSALDVMSELAVCEVESFIFTHYHSKHISTLRRLLDTAAVRRVWLPEPQTEAERYVFLDLLDAVVAAGSEAVIYSGGYAGGVAGEAGIFTAHGYIKRSTHPVLYISASAPGNASVVYIGTSLHESGLFADGAEEITRASAVIFGAHGPVTKSGYDYPLPEALELILYANGEILGFHSPASLPRAAEMYADIERRRIALSGGILIK